MFGRHKQNLIILILFLASSVFLITARSAAELEIEEKKAALGGVRVIVVGSFTKPSDAPQVRVYAKRGYKQSLFWKTTNWELLGKAPGLFKTLETGQHDIRIEADEYESAEVKVYIERDKVLVLEVEPFKVSAHIRGQWSFFQVKTVK